MRFHTHFVYFVALVALGISAVVVWAGMEFGQFRTITAEGNMSCTPVDGVDGPADIAQVPGTSAAYFSSFDRRGEALRGKILRIDIADSDSILDQASWRDRTGGQPAAFEPMGIDLYQVPLPTGGYLTRLFVVNLAGPEVLLYDVDANGDLALREAFSEPRLVSPNDVVATGPQSFYVTNDTSAGRESWRGRLEFLLGMRTGQVLHFDGNSWSDVAVGLAFPNGLALSEDGQTLYLAETRAKSLKQFSRDPNTDVLTLRDQIHLQTFPDNLSLDTDGNVFVGAVPQPLTFGAYDDGLRDVAPSSVLRVSQSGLIETVFQDPGDVLSAATIGVRIEDKLLIGSRAADRFLMCQNR